MEMDTSRIPWRKLRENIFHKHLARDEERNFQMDLIQLKPGMRYGEHLHPDVEWVFILKGSFSDENGSYNAGDFIVNKKNSTHIVTTGQEGAELLVFWCGTIIPQPRH